MEKNIKELSEESRFIDKIQELVKNEISELSKSEKYLNYAYFTNEDISKLNIGEKGEYRKNIVFHCNFGSEIIFPDPRIRENKTWSKKHKNERKLKSKLENEKFKLFIKSSNEININIIENKHEIETDNFIENFENFLLFEKNTENSEKIEKLSENCEESEKLCEIFDN